MSDDNSAQNPVVLTMLPSEAQAAILVAALAGDGIHAEMSGTLTSGFRAEAPGDVKILVTVQDFDRAQKILNEHENTE